MSRIDLERLRQQLEGRWDAILRAFVPEVAEALDRPGRHVTCPFHGGKRDFRVFKNVADDGRAICTCGAWHDGFALIQHARGWSFPETLRQLDAHLGGTAAAIAPVVARPRKPSAVEAQQIQHRHERVWHNGIALTHDVAAPARKYLQSRGLDVPQTKVLRFHPSLAYHDEDGVFIGYFPAMIAAVVTLGGSRVTVHRTYLTESGEKADLPAAKKNMEVVPGTTLLGAAIRLAAPLDGILGVAEGIETALSATALTGVPCWSTVAAPFLEAFEPPPDIKRLFVFADKDRSGTGEKVAQRLVERMWARGLQAAIYLPALELGDAKSVDWNDVLTKIGRGSEEVCYG